MKVKNQKDFWSGLMLIGPALFLRFWAMAFYICSANTVRNSWLFLVNRKTHKTVVANDPTAPDSAPMRMPIPGVTTAPGTRRRYNQTANAPPPSNQRQHPSPSIGMPDKVAEINPDSRAPLAARFH